jgi:hypothetical protein
MFAFCIVIILDKRVLIVFCQRIRVFVPIIELLYWFLFLLIVLVNQDQPEV